MEDMIYGSQPKHILIFFPFSVIKTRSLYEGWLGIYTPSFFLNQASCPLPIILDVLFTCHQKEESCCFKKFGNYWSNIPLISWKRICGPQGQSDLLKGTQSKSLTRLRASKSPISHAYMCNPLPFFGTPVVRLANEGVSS